LTVVKKCLPYRWPSRAQVERGLDGMHGITVVFGLIIAGHLAPALVETIWKN